jgi:threonine dehydrogenase-like Zn-dependent dehydrogenase
MAAYSGILRGASKVFVVDTVPERLQAAEKIGCVPIDFKASDPVEQIIKLNGGMVDRAVDAVGYQANDSSGADPGAPDSQSQKGQILISFGKLFEKVRFDSEDLAISC